VGHGGIVDNEEKESYLQVLKAVGEDSFRTPKHRLKVNKGKHVFDET
jgi:hypothetical protein